MTKVLMLIILLKNFYIVFKVSLNELLSSQISSRKGSFSLISIIVSIYYEVCLDGKSHRQQTDCFKTSLILVKVKIVYFWSNSNERMDEQIYVLSIILSAQSIESNQN